MSGDHPADIASFLCARGGTCTVPAVTSTDVAEDVAKHFVCFECSLLARRSLRLELMSEEEHRTLVTLVERGPAARAAEDVTEPPPAASLLVRRTILVLLVMQTSTVVLLMRFSNTHGRPPYIASAAVLTAEMIKLPICLAMVARAVGWRHVPAFLLDELRSLDTIKCAVPAGAFSSLDLQNLSGLLGGAVGLSRWLCSLRSVLHAAEQPALRRARQP